MDLACSQDCFQFRLNHIHKDLRLALSAFWIASQQVPYFLLDHVEWQSLLGHQKSPHGGTKSPKCFAINIKSFIFKLAIK